MEIPLVYYGGGNFMSFFYDDQDQDNKTNDLADAITKCNGSDLGEFTWKDSNVQDGGGPNDEISNKVKVYLKNRLDLNNSENNIIFDHIIEKYGIIEKYMFIASKIPLNVTTLGFQQSKDPGVIFDSQVMEKLIKDIETIPHVKLLNCNK